jgi:hypothetical protein
LKPVEVEGRIKLYRATCLKTFVMLVHLLQFSEVNRITGVEFDPLGKYVKCQVVSLVTSQFKRAA